MLGGGRRARSVRHDGRGRRLRQSASYTAVLLLRCPNPPSRRQTLVQRGGHEQRRVRSLFAVRLPVQHAAVASGSSVRAAPAKSPAFMFQPLPRRPVLSLRKALVLAPQLHGLRRLCGLLQRRARAGGGVRAEHRVGRGGGGVRRRASAVAGATAAATDRLLRGRTRRPATPGPGGAQRWYAYLGLWEMERRDGERGYCVRLAAGAGSTCFAATKSTRGEATAARAGRTVAASTALASAARISSRFMYEQSSASEMICASTDSPFSSVTA